MTKNKQKILKLGTKAAQDEIVNCIRKNISFEAKTNDGRIFYIAGKGNEQGILGKHIDRKTFIFKGAVNPRLGFMGEWVEI